jgi:hypothetical protein
MAGVLKWGGSPWVRGDAVSSLAPPSRNPDEETWDAMSRPTCLTRCAGDGDRGGIAMRLEMRLKMFDRICILSARDLHAIIIGT